MLVSLSSVSYPYVVTWPCEPQANHENHWRFFRTSIARTLPMPRLDRLTALLPENEKWLPGRRPAGRDAANACSFEGAEFPPVLRISQRWHPTAPWFHTDLRILESPEPGTGFPAGTLRYSNREIPAAATHRSSSGMSWRHRDDAFRVFAADRKSQMQSWPPRCSSGPTLPRRRAAPSAPARAPDFPLQRK